MYVKTYLLFSFSSLKAIILGELENHDKIHQVWCILCAGLPRSVYGSRPLRILRQNALGRFAGGTGDLTIPRSPATL